MSAAEDLDHTPMARSRKYPGLTPSQIGEKDPQYLCWCYESMTPKPCSKLLYDDCKADVARDRQSMRVARDQDI